MNTRLVPLICLSILLACVIARAADTPIIADNLDGITLGNPTNIAYEVRGDGQAAVYDAPWDSIEYPASAFATLGGRITFDLKFTQPVTGSHPWWCLFSDVGAGNAYPGSVNLLMCPDSPVLDFGIFDGANWHWCHSTGVDWQPNVWYSVGMAYGSGGMRLEVNGTAAGSNNYAGGLSTTSKRLGFTDAYDIPPPMAVDNFRTYSTPIFSLRLSDYIICPVADGLLDSTTITYEVAEDSIVTIEALDHAGGVAATLLERESAAAGTHTLSWNGGGLPNGDYTIRMTATFPSGSRQASDTVCVDNRWTWSRPPRMFRDYLPRSAYYFWENDAAVPGTHVDDPEVVRAYFERTLADLRAHGVDMIMGCWTPADHRQILLDVAQQKGIKVMIHLYEMNYWITGGQETNPFDVANSSTQDLRSHPALMGYYVIDEPGNSPGLTARIKLAKQALEAVDPAHPSFACLLGAYESVLATTDFQTLLVDIYPLGPSWNGDWSGYISELERGQRNAGDRQFWLIPQLFGKQGTWKIPTPEEVRTQVWLALAYGVRGFMYFIYQSTTNIQGEWLQGMVDMQLNPMDGRLDEIGRLNADLARLAPALLSLHSEPFELPPVPSTIVIKPFANANGAQYAVVVNKDTRNASAFTWTGGLVKDVLTGERIGSEVSLPAGGGRLLQFLPPGRVQGSVVSADGTALSGATVTAEPGGYAATTAQDGHYSLVGLPSGTYILRAGMLGYVTGEAEVNVVASAVTQDFTLQRSGGGTTVGGLSPVGLLMRVCGRVTRVAEDAGSFCIDDGSGSPVKVDLSHLVTMPGNLPGVGEYVGVTGIVVRTRDGDRVTTALRPRGSSDIDSY